MKNTVEIPSIFVPYILDALKAAVDDSIKKRNAAYFASQFDDADYYKGQTIYFIDAYNALVDASEKLS